VCCTSFVSHGWSGTGPLLKKLSLEKPAAASTCCSDVQATSSPQATATESLVAGWLTLNEFAILEAVCDTLFPSLNPPAGSSEAVVAYHRRCARDLNLAQLVVETLSSAWQASSTSPFLMRRVSIPTGVCWIMLHRHRHLRMHLSLSLLSRASILIKCTPGKGRCSPLIATSSATLMGTTVIS